jgi:hypothetical protein
VIVHRYGDGLFFDEKRADCAVLEVSQPMTSREWMGGR